MIVRTALVLAGHGSHISPETGGVVWRQVDSLRRSGVADEVTAAFWKEAPSFHDVFRTLTADDITVVPLFTARGYFTQTVIPAEMGLTGTFSERDGRLIRYTPPLGEHPTITQFGIRRVREGLAVIGDNISSDQVAVAVIGHSTRRNPESRRATEAQAESIRAAALVAEAVTVFLDDSPEIAELYRLTTAPIIIAVPYFLAVGSHVSIDVPARLGLQPGQTTGHIHGRTVYYLPPVGTDKAISEAIVDLVRRTSTPAPLHFVERGAAATSRPPRYEVTAGNQRERCGQGAATAPLPPLHFVARGIEGVRFTFGELELTASDIHRAGDPSPKSEICSLSELRAIGRGTRPSDRFRPLATARNLPGGWHFPVPSPEALHMAVETIYPGAVADWAAYQEGTLPIESLETVVARQTGQFRALKALSASDQSKLVQTVCDNCVRHPTWHVGESPSDTIPCPAPCNWWMSHALKTLESHAEKVTELIHE